MIVHKAANCVVRLSIAGGECALRVPQIDDALLQVDRRSEYAALAAAAAAGLAPRILACDPESGVLITGWIDAPVWTADEARRPRNIELLAGRLRQLHALPPPAGVRPLDLGRLMRRYWDTLRGREAELPADFPQCHAAALRLLERRTTAPPRLCHNDLHCGNLIGTGADLKFLDWEYAGLGEPLFDLASYAQANALNAGQREILLGAYGTTALRERFDIECRLFDWICLLWLAVARAS